VDNHAKARPSSRFCCANNRAISDTIEPSVTRSGDQVVISHHHYFPRRYSSGSSAESDVTTGGISREMAAQMFQRCRFERGPKLHKNELEPFPSHEQLPARREVGGELVSRTPVCNGRVGRRVGGNAEISPGQCRPSKYPPLQGHHSFPHPKKPEGFLREEVPCLTGEKWPRVIEHHIYHWAQFLMIIGKQAHMGILGTPVRNADCNGEKPLRTSKPM